MDIEVRGSFALPFIVGFAACCPFLALRIMVSIFSTTIFFPQFAQLIGSLIRSLLLWDTGNNILSSIALGFIQHTLLLLDFAL